MAAEHDSIKSIMRSDDVAESVSELLVRAVGIPLNEDLLKAHIAPICQTLEPSSFLAKTLCTCDFMVEIIGKSLSNRLRSFIYCIDYGLPEPDNADSTTQALLHELVETRQALTALRAHVASGQHGHRDYVCDAGDDENQSLAIKPLAQRGGSATASDAKNHKASMKTSTLAWALNANLAFKNTPQTLIDAARLTSLLRDPHAKKTWSP